jgi:glycosyltransferase involved in cell wall biosynthesis
MSRAQLFIKDMEKFYGRRLHPFNVYLIKKFEKYMTEQKNVPAVSGEKVTFEPYVLPDLSAEIKANSKKHIAFIHEDVGHMTGGRYYAYFIISGLLELGYNVTVYTNKRPVFGDEFDLYKKPKFKLVSKTTQGLRTVDFKADIYIGSPINGNIAAIKLGKKYKKPAYALVFDPFNMMHEFIGRRQFKGWEELIPLLEQKDTNIISLCNATSKYIYKWLGKDETNVFPVYPCINSKVLHNADRVVERGDYVLFISRLVAHKRFEDVLQAVKRTNMRLKVISSVNGVKAQLLVSKYSMKNRVDFHLKVSDQE